MTPATWQRLREAAYAERSRLWRYRVRAAQVEALRLRALEAQEARVFRCPGCGDWRYESTHRHGALGTRVRCAVCGAGRILARAARAAA